MCYFNSDISEIYVGRIVKQHHFYLVTITLLIIYVIKNVFKVGNDSCLYMTDKSRYISHLKKNCRQS